MFTVCIIDDEAPMCDILGRLFTRMGWTTTLVTDSRVAASQVRTAGPDAVLLDLMMPEVDGFGVLAAIRSDETTADTPVIFYSAVCDEQVRARAIAAGADDYIVKTTPFAQVLDRLSSHARRRTRRGGSPSRSRDAATAARPRSAPRSPDAGDAPPEA
jgi:DNA-binding response OmpR family regulator